MGPGAGHTRRLAEAIAKGAGTARLIDVTAMGAEDWDALDEAQAIVFGTPTFWGSSAAPFDQFIEDAAGDAGSPGDGATSWPVASRWAATGPATRA